jgi:TRAP transporter TAXI family solute receptor
VYRKSRLIFVVSEMDDVSLQLGSTIAPALAARVPDSKAMMATAATAVDVVKLLTSAQLDVALLTSDDAYEALQGVGRFKGSATPLRTLAAVGSSVLHLVTLRDRGIAGVADLKGKTLASGIPGSPTETLALRVLEASRIDPEKDLSRQPLAGERAVAALTKKEIDAIARADIVANRTMRELAGRSGSAISLLEHDDALPNIEAKYGPVYRRATIPKNAYPGISADVGGVAVTHLLVCRDDFPQDKASRIVKALAEPHDDAMLAQPLIPFHPGALEFYRGGSTPR